LLIAVAVVLVVGIIAARFVAGFFVDYLWFDSVGRSDVFWGVFNAKLTLFGMFAGTFIVLAVLNLLIADRLAPTSFAANVHPLVERFHTFFGKRLRLFRLVLAVFVGILAALPTIGRWQDWLMFNNSKSFGINDPHFGNDVGFYMFKLPFVTFVIDWLFIAFLVITILVVFDHVLSGGIVLQPSPKVRRATKAHIAVLLGVLAVLKAADYWVTRYELTTANRGAVRGITYAVDNAQLPAVLLLVMVALATAALYLSTLKTDYWRPAVVASAMWAVMALVGGMIYPAVVQSLVVNPNQKDKEDKYIAYNIQATRHALGIDNVQVRDVEFGDLTRGDLQANVAALQDARLLKPVKSMIARFQADEPQPGTKVTDVDPDRYVIDGVERQVIVGARELDLSQVGNKSWQGTHLINTHGCGVVMAPAAQVESSNRLPVYDESIAAVDRPEIYFGTSMSGYAVLNTTVNETACEGQEVAPYNGTGGVQLNSTLRRLAFALNEFDYNLLGSSAIDDGSRFVSVRNVADRVNKVAPFLSLDGDPYPVVVGGRILWVIDGYTTSNRYPYGESADRKQLGENSGLDQPFNYIRNSVKAVVDAYDGSVLLYVVDSSDPVLQVWQSAFPDLFVDGAEMPAGLRDHLRYPEELFRVQTTAYSKYRLDRADFFDRRGAWSLALAAPSQDNSPSTGTADETSTTVAAEASSSQFASDSNAPRFDPYYTMFHADGTDEATFQLLRPFQPFSTSDQYKNLVAYMTASSDPDTYGQLVAYVLPAGSEVDGPYNIGSKMNSDPDVSAYATLNNNPDGNSRIEYGDLQLLPVAGGVLWIRPLYVESTSSGQPAVNKMIVSYNGKVAMSDSIGGALAELFPGFSAQIGDVVGTDSGTDNGTDNPPPNDNATAAELLAEADQLFDEADAAIRRGDWGTYGEKIQAARALVQRALDLLEQAGES